MSITVDDVSEGDVLEASFYSKAMDAVVRVAIDVDHAAVDDEDNKYRVVSGEVLVVKNMPFDALEGKTIRLDVKDDEVQKDDHYGPVIGSDIELLSV